MQHAEVPAERRAAFLARVRARHAFFARERCRYWAFEDTSRPGTFLEFVEAADASRLRAALDAAPEQGTGPVSVYAEVEC
ncbi:MAG: hypothetical protein ACREON_07180 [Gemmatimonadaceae bacterium]